MNEPYEPKTQEYQGTLIPFPQTFKEEVPTEAKEEKKPTHSKIKLRLYSFFVDLFFIGLLQKVLVFSYVHFINENFHQVPPQIKTRLLTSLSELRIPTLILTFFSYFLVSLYLGHGKTLGKTIFKLRVVSHEDDPGDLSFMEAFMRTLGYTTCYVTGALNPILPLLLFSMPVWRKTSRGLPDLFSQTEVATEEEFEEYVSSLESQEESELPEEEDSQLDLFAS